MDKIDKKSLWLQILENIKISVSPAIFNTWFSQTFLLSLKKTGENRYSAEIGCPSTFIKTTIESRYFGMIQDLLTKAISTPCDLAFVVHVDPDNAIKPDKSDTVPLFEKQSNPEALNQALADARIRPGFTFENFAVSGSNQMAWAAAEAVAQKPGRAYNPLFIWGGVGVGKTHLMVSVGYKLLEENVDNKVLFCSGEEFTNDIVEGIRNKSTPTFRNKYRRLDCLLLDDIQFIAGKDAVQEEFFHTFNAVTGAGGQIILTSDKPPSEIAKLEERLRSRFEAGLIVDIAPADFELRCAIIQIKSREKGIPLEMPLIQLIAANVDGARQIEGLLTKLLTHIRFNKSELNEELITNLLGKKVDNDQNGIKSRDPNAIIEAVSNYYSLSKRALMSQVRTRMLVTPRQILMYILRTDLGLPLEEVGRLVGGRDHSTIMHGVQRITRDLSTNARLREDILVIKNSL